MRKGFFDAPRGHDGIQMDELDAWNLKQHNSELQKKVLKNEAVNRVNVLT